MASVEEKVMLRKTVQREYLLGLYAIATGHPVNMNDFVEVKLEFESAPSKMDAHGNSVWTVQVLKKDLSREEFDINLQQYSIMTSLMRTAGAEKQPHLEDMITYLVRRHAHIQKVMNHNDPVFVEPIEDYYKQSGRPGTYGVNIHYRPLTNLNGPVRKELFQVPKVDYDKIVELDNMPHIDKKGELLPPIHRYPKTGDPVKKPFRQDPRFQIKCKPEIKQIPGLLKSKGLRDAQINRHPGTEIKTMAFQCPCPKGYFCTSIRAIFLDGQDLLHWGSVISKVVVGDPELICVGVPLAGYILYGVPIESSRRVNWDDSQSRKLMMYGDTEDITVFYDDPRDSKDKIYFPMLYDRMMDLENQIDAAVEAIVAAGVPSHATDKFISGACHSGKHNYGASRKVIDLIDKNEDGARIAVACLHLYGMCPACYTNANPAFSLLSPDLF